MEYLLEIKNLVVEYKTERATVHALNDVNLSIGKGESLGLVGEAGAGKTTTALSILNLLPSSANIKTGSIVYKGQSLLDMKERDIRLLRGSSISMIFQNPLTALNPVFSVGEQIAVLLRTHRDMSRKEATIKAQELLEMVGIAKYRVNDYPIQFSGGMRQRVGIAAGLACNPELLIADEPTTALDVTIQAQILELMRKMQKEYDSSLLMITHNLGIISELCQKVAVMYAGRIIEYGTVHEVFKDPRHYYTVGLINALPKINDTQERLATIPGRVADAQNLPKGCAFHPRCSGCMEKCKHEVPEMVKVGENHYVACHRSEGGVL